LSWAQGESLCDAVLKQWDRTWTAREWRRQSNIHILCIGCDGTKLPLMLMLILMLIPRGKTALCYQQLGTHEFFPSCSSGCFSRSRLADCGPSLEMMSHQLWGGIFRPSCFCSQ
jgi:hypothetical protein